MAHLVPSMTVAIVLGLTTWLMTPLMTWPAHAAAPVEVAVQDLSADCQAVIAAHAPDAAEELEGPDVNKDARGDLSVGWASRSGTFFAAESGEADAAQAIAKGCPAVAIVIYSGPTGGSERWYIRHDGFKVRHFRDSGMQGDHDKYWGWETVPFDYDPAQSYKSAE